MTNPFAHSHAAPMSFETAWERNARLLAAASFGAVAYTEELNALAICVFAGLWLTAWFVGAPRFWRPWVGNFALIVCAGAIGFFALRETFTGVLYLLCFLAAAKCFALTEPRDHLHMVVVTFLMLLACSAIMVSANFLCFVVLYLTLLLPELSMMSQARDAAAVEGRAWRVRPAPRKRLRNGFRLALATLALSVPVFYLVPHTVERNFRPGGMPPRTDETQATSGFSGELDIRPLDHIAPDDTVAMIVYAHWDRGVTRPMPPSLRLRGAILDSFDGTRWTRGFRSNNLTVEDQHDVKLRDPGPDEAVLVQQYDLDLTNERHMFSQPEVLRYHFQEVYGPKMRLDPVSGLMWVTSANDAAGKTLTHLEYTAYSSPVDERFDASPAQRGTDTPAADDANLRETGGGIPGLSPEERAYNTALPDARNTRGMQRIRAISDEMLGPISGTEAKVERLIDWFDGEFSYTLSPQSPRGMNPIVGFLTVTHKGHCEYFATSLALLLRAQGIPVRLVTGYYPTRTPGATNTYTVRRSDAHAWTEVWFPKRGWTVVDPTPPDHRGRASYGNSLEIFWVQQVSSVRTLWRKFVLNYNQATQGEIIQALLNLPALRAVREFDWDDKRELLRRLRLWFDMGAWLGDWGREHVAITNLLSALVVPSALVAALAALLAAIQWRRMRRREIRMERSRIGFMNIMLARLKRQGIQRERSQTPGELLEHSAPGIDEELAAWLVELYRRMRFGGYRPTRGELSEALRIVKGMAS